MLAQILFQKEPIDINIIEVIITIVIVYQLIDTRVFFKESIKAVLK